MDTYIKIVDELCEITEDINNQQLRTLSKFLSQRINNPDTYLVFLGESCSGKSTLINSIIGKSVLPVSGVPSTGAITEVNFDCAATDDVFYAINKDASMEEIEESVFTELAINPDKELERLRYKTRLIKDTYKGIRIFDTPGYGSLIKEHNEVLTSFIPNADAIVYMVSYRDGFQEDDYDFLKGLLDLTRKNVPIYLLINRCPIGISTDDKRVKEIYRYVTSLLQKTELPLTLVESDIDEDMENTRASMSVFMNAILEDLYSETRRKELKEAFGGFIQDLIRQVRAEIERLIRNIKLSDEQKKQQDEALDILLKKLESADEEIVEPGFTKIRNEFPTRLEASRQRIEYKTNIAIDEQSKFAKEETATYVKLHVLNYNAQQEVKELQLFLETELNALDKEVYDYLNTAIIEFEADLRLKCPGQAYEEGIKLAKGFGSRFINAGLLVYFAKFGGAGGAAAGIANAASHTLKKVGNLFGKTFSKETHNALKHTLKVLGLTSTKVLAASASAFIEIVSFVVDYNTWQSKLKNQVTATTHDWAKEIEDVISEDLKRLEWENVKNIRDMADEYKKAFSTEEEPEQYSLEFLEKSMDRVKRLESEVA